MVSGYKVAPGARPGMPLESVMRAAQERTFRVNVNISMNLRLWSESPGVEQLGLLEMLATQGYAGVEVPLGGQSTSTLKILAAAAADLDLGLTTCARLPAGANPLSPERGVRRAAVDALLQRLDESVLLGSKLLCGGFFQAQGEFSGYPPSDREWEWSRQCLREVGERAAQLGITLALEFQSRFDAHLINTAAVAARMCRDIGLDNIGVTYNTFHAHLEESNPAEALPATGGRLVHVRLAESHRGELGRGQVPFPETFATLDFLGYEGWLVVEALAPGVGSVHPENIWRSRFDDADQLSANALAMVNATLRQLRH